MKILHFGDIHVWEMGMDWSDPFYFKRWLGMVNLAMRRRHRFPPAYAEQVVHSILEQDADWVIFTGDFTTSSSRKEFGRAAELFKPIHEKWGDRFIAIPGNHDRYTTKTIRDRRYEEAFPYAALDREANMRCIDLSAQISLVTFDCSEPFWVRSNGRLREPMLQRLDQELKKLAEQGRKTLLAGHFPYATPPEHPETWEHKLIGEESLARLAADHAPIAYLHGHKHVRWALRPEETPGTLCLNCGSAGMKSTVHEKQAGYLTFHTSDKGVSEIQAHVLNADSGLTEPSDIPIP